MFQLGKIDWINVLFVLIYIEVVVYFIYAHALVFMFGLLLDLVFI